MQMYDEPCFIMCSVYKYTLNVEKQAVAYAAAE